MRAKKLSVAVVSNADMKNAIGELKEIMSGRLKLFGTHEYFEPVSSDGPIARALVPFNKVAAGAMIKADPKIIDLYCVEWFDFCSWLEGDTADLRTSLGLVVNGFINVGSAFMCAPVFAGDYGVFRFNLSKAVFWKFLEQGGAIRDGARIAKIENGNRARDKKICEARLLARGEWSDNDVKAAQVQIAVENYKGNLARALLAGLQPTEFHGRKIDGDVGYLKELICDCVVRRNSENKIVMLKGFPAKGYYQKVRRTLEALGKLERRKR